MKDLSVLPSPAPGVVLTAPPVPAHSVSVAQVTETLLSQHPHLTGVVRPGLVGPDGVAEILHRFVILRLVLAFAVLRPSTFPLSVNNTLDGVILRHNPAIPER